MKLRARKLIGWVHLWTALVLGLFLALLGLSGSVLVLRAPLLEWEVGSAAVRLQAPASATAAYAGEQAWKDSARSAYPQFDRIRGAVGPRGGFLISDNAMAFGSVKGRRGMGIAMLDPYDATPRAFFVFDDLWLAKAVALHRALLLPPPIGTLVVALCGVALSISLLTGLWLWWPRGWQWSKWSAALTFHRQSRGLRWWRELHNVTASYLFIPLMLLALTGIWLARPGWFSWGESWGLGRGFKAMASALHGELMLGTAGEVLVALAGLVLPLLYVSGLVMWWRKRQARRAALGVASSH